MPGGKIYLRERDGLVAMSEARYDAEEILQRLLADYPDLLAGDQMRPSEPRRWLLITREAGIPDVEGGQPRWSLDHLFIDQDAIPTLVEVKRSSDTRIRREVVGQILDYAANIVAYWPGPQLRQLFEDRPRPEGASPDDELLKLLDLATSTELEGSHAIDEYWQRASANLAARQIRLVFVADVIPPELQRIVEFLNESLVRVEVLAVEVKQYIGQGPGGEERQTLVPRVIGRTAASEDVKQTASGSKRVVKTWTESEFLEAALASGGPSAERLARRVMDWDRRHGVAVLLGKGKSGPLYLQAQSDSGESVKIANINPQGYTVIDFEVLVKFSPFDRAEERLELAKRLNEIPGAQIPDRSAVEAFWPGIDAKTMAPEAAQNQLFEIFKWVADRLAEKQQAT